MQIRKNTCIWLLSLTTLFYSLHSFGFQDIVSPPSSSSFPTGMSDTKLMEEFKKMEQELSAAIEAMSPEEKEQLFAEVEKLQNMSEDELNAYVNEMFAEEIKAIEAKESKPQEQAPEASSSVSESSKVESKKAISSEEEQAITLIKALIKNINLLLQKAGQTSELGAKISRWKKAGKVSWDKDAEWSTMKPTIEKLMQRLHTLLEINPRTNDYKYLKELIANKELVAELKQLDAVLQKEIKDINLPEFELVTMSKKSNLAWRKALDAIHKAFYKSGILKSIDAVIEKFNPEAKKIREEEEKAKQKAIEASKATRTPASARVAGKADSQFAPYTATDSGFSFDMPSYGGYSSPSYGSYGDYSFSSPKESTPAAGTKSGFGAGSAAGGAGDKGKSGSAEAGKEGDKGKANGGDKGKEGDKAKSAAAGEQKQGQAAPPAYTPTADDKKIISDIYKIGDLVNDAARMMDNATLKKLRFAIEDQKTPVDEALQANLPLIIANLNKAIIAIGELKEKVKEKDKNGKAKFDKKQLDYFKGELASVLEGNKKVFEAVSHELQASLNDADKLDKQASKAKKEAYLGYVPTVEMITGLAIDGLIDAQKETDEKSKKELAQEALGALTQVEELYSTEEFKKSLAEVKKAYQANELKEDNDPRVAVVAEQIALYKTEHPDYPIQKIDAIAAIKSVFSILGLLDKLQKAVKGF